MARLDYGRAQRASLWRQSVRDTWSGHVPQATTPPTEKQINYLKILLEKAGRRPYTEDELATLTMHSVSRLINELKAAAK